MHEPRLRLLGATVADLHADGDGEQVPVRLESVLQFCPQPDRGVRRQHAAIERVTGQYHCAVTGQPDRSGGQVRDAAHAGATIEGQHPLGRWQPRHRAIAKPRLGSPEAQRTAVQLEHRPRFKNSPGNANLLIGKLSATGAFVAPRVPHPAPAITFWVLESASQQDRASANREPFLYPRLCGFMPANCFCAAINAGSSGWRTAQRSPCCSTECALRNYHKRMVSFAQIFCQ